MRVLFAFSIFSILQISAYGQSFHKHSRALALKNIDTYTHALSQKAAIQHLSHELHLGKDDELREVSSYEFGVINHVQLKQYHQGLLVYGSKYHLHGREGKISSSNGILYPSIKVDINPTYGIHELEAYIKDHHRPTCNHDDATHDHGAWQTLSSELVIIDAAYPALSGEYHLAYRSVIENKSTHAREKVLYDAHSLALIFSEDMICSHGVPSHGESHYYGNVDFVSDSIAPNKFYLYDPTRDISIINDRTGLLYTSESSNWDLKNEKEDEFALDAMYCTKGFYDMMKESFNWTGIDNNGGPLIANIDVNNERNYVNAYWNGESTNYGYGNCQYNTLTTVSIVGHEFMHGVTDYTSDLIYYSESGAINEAYSDIFGKYLEYKLRPNEFSWRLDEIIGNYFRSMKNPHEVNDPSYYKGRHWIGAEPEFPSDNEGVHSNSGVLNYWTAVLVDGGNYTNEFGDQYQIDALGWEKVINILWIAHTSYLVSNSNYKDLAKAVYSITEDLYGAASTEYNNIDMAWKLVGIERSDLTDNFVDLTFSYNNERTICMESDTIHLPITITNLGSTAWINNGDMAFISRSLTASNEYVSKPDLPDAILPDASYETVISIVPDTDITNEFWLMTYLYDSSDEYRSNNRRFTSLELLKQNSNFINYQCEIEASEGCDYNSIDIVLTLTNSTCEKINIDDEFNFLFKDGDYINQQVTLDTNLNVYAEIDPGDDTFLYYSIPADDMMKSSQSLVVTNENWIDTNNIRTYELDLANPTLVDQEYREDYENEPNGNWNGSSLKGITSYGGSLQYYTTMDDYSSYSTCKRSSRILKSYHPFIKNYAKWDACVDLSDVDDPIFKFDLTQFREEELSDFVSAVTIVKWEDEGNEVVHFISDQPEGIASNHVFELPKYYEGIVEIISYNAYGDIDDEGNIDFTRDVQLYDNIFIGSKSSTSNNNIPISTARIYPNPSTNELYISSKRDFSKYEIYDLMGSKIDEGNYLSGSRISIESLRSGTYVIRLLSDDQQMFYTKFIKL